MPRGTGGKRSACAVEQSGLTRVLCSLASHVRMLCRAVWPDEISVLPCLCASCASSMTNLGSASNPVWGWAGAEQVNADMAAASRGPAKVPKAKPCDEIVARLFLGTRDCASTPSELASRGIGLTVGVGGDGLKLEDTDIIRAHVAFTDEDGGSLLALLPAALKQVREGMEGGGGVLGFSESGQASTALAAAFLMADRGMTFDEAQRLIVEKRERAARKRSR